MRWKFRANFKSDIFLKFTPLKFRRDDTHRLYIVTELVKDFFKNRVGKKVVITITQDKRGLFGK